MQTLSPLAENTLIVSWTFTGLAIIFFCVAIFTHRRIELHDIFSLAALITGLALVAQMTWAVLKEGEGEHQRNIPLEIVPSLAKSLLLNEALWTLSNTFLRFSACSFLRIIFNSFNYLVVLIISTAIACAIHGVASVLELFLICRPFSAQWDPHVNGACGNQKLSFLAIESVGLILDCIILAMPIREISALRLTFKQKLPIMIIFNLGIIIIIITAVRLNLLHMKGSSDFIYSQSFFVMLSSASCMIGVMVCSAPPVRLVFTKNIIPWVTYRFSIIITEHLRLAKISNPGVSMASNSGDRVSVSFHRNEPRSDQNTEKDEEAQKLSDNESGDNFMKSGGSSTLIVYYSPIDYSLVLGSLNR